ncbi:GNAT family N-acetyltransferase [Pontibacter kalidii]|uniref:GNAT family N-acetyltransferase n=1 Tax=Pontibacter kalidii TaxID=2592049 RepID=UPI00224D1D46|nr:GNAT family N-acetyltransferase [Pontibacter kalidii]
MIGIAKEEMEERKVAIKAAVPCSFIELLAGHDALELLSDPTFQAAWNELYESCPWATVFQSKTFVLTWYSLYTEEYLPILVKSSTNDKLTGLLLLAKSNKGTIVGAGANRAEYQTWLAEAAEGVKFIKEALGEVRKAFPTCDIILKFIPPNVPLEWARKEAPWRRICVLRAFNQPLWELENEKIARRLKKQKSKINHLKKLGELTLEVITTVEQFRSIIDFIIIQSDFRKGAIYNTTPFQEDPQRKELLLKLFEKDFLHVSIIKLNEKIIAAKVATKADNCIISQGVSSYAPAYAPYSPGMLHFLFLAKRLMHEGCSTFDLTPGEDAFKKELATKNLLASELHITGTAKSLVTARCTKLYFDNVVKKKAKIYALFSRIGISPKTLRQTIRKIKIVAETVRHTKPNDSEATLWGSQFLLKSRISLKYKVFKIRASSVAKLKENIKIDDLEDLLKYDSSSKLLRGEFLTNAMGKFELGQHAYTLTEGTCLLCCVWVKEQARNSKGSAVELKHAIPDGSKLIYNVYCHPKGRSQLQDFLATVSNLISSDREIYAVINVADKFLCSTLQKEAFIERVS